MDFSETDQQISILEEAIARITTSHSPRAVPGGIRTAVAEATANVASKIISDKHVRAGDDTAGSTIQVVHYTKVETAIHLLENTCHAEKNTPICVCTHPPRSTIRTRVCTCTEPASDWTRPSRLD